MTQTEMLGQKLVFGFHGTSLSPEFKALIRKYKIGNVILFLRNVESADQLRRLCDEIRALIQEETGYPPFIIIDQEGGMVSRLPKDAVNVPGAMALAATGNPENARLASEITIRQLKGLGANFNMAPVLDVNSNASNPVIGVRSFGDNPEAVAAFGCASLAPYRGSGVLCCAKHFPGHGDTAVDSHLGLPRVDKTEQELEALELIPFRRAIAQSGGLTGDFARYPSLQEAEARGEAFLRHLGVSSIAEARALDARTLLDKTLSWKGPRWSPVLDGTFLQEDPCDAILHGRQNDVELMCGNTADEGAFRFGNTLEEFLPNARRLWKDDYDRMIDLAGIRTDEDIERYYHARAFHPFEVGNHFAARCWERQGRKPAWLYRFNPEIPGDHAGSFHSSELWFVFETLAKCWRPFEGKHYDLARQMCNYWTNFARTGDPNGPDHNGSPMPLWPPCTAENGESVMLLDDAPHAICPETDALFAFEVSRHER